MDNLKPRLSTPYLLCCLLLLGGGAEAKPPKPVTVSAEVGGAAVLAQPFVIVNGESQSNARAEMLLREQLVRGAPDSPELRQAVRQSLVTQAVMAQEARKIGLLKNPLLQAQIELAQNDLLARAWQQKVLEERSPREDEVKAEYDRQLASLGDTDYRLRHVLVKDEASARALLDQIKTGAKLADLAQSNSLDNESRQRGGVSDWINVSRLMPPLADALKKLKNGEILWQPVQTDAGWHVLQREESRPFQTLPYEQAKPQMQAVVAQRIIEERLKALIEQAKVK